MSSEDEDAERWEGARGAVVGVAYAALMAGILLRDMLGAMPPAIYLTFPDDVRERMNMTVYQDTFDRLPEDIREEATALVMADPTIVAARRIDRGSS